MQVLLAGLSLALVAIFLLADVGGGGGGPAPQQTAAQARLPRRVDLGQDRCVDASVFFFVWGCFLLVCCPRWWQSSCWQTWAAAAAAARTRSQLQHRRASFDRKIPQCRCTVAGMLLNGPAF